MDLDEVAYYEPPYQDLRCFQIQLFSSLLLKELISIICLKHFTNVVMKNILLAAQILIKHFIGAVFK